MQELKRLGEEEAALVIRRALEIQGEPGSVTLEELRLAATELRIDPAALEQAILERGGNDLPSMPERTFFVDVKHPALVRMWRTISSESILKQNLPPETEHQRVFSAPGHNDCKWTIQLKGRQGPGQVTVEKQDDIVTLSGDAKMSTSIVVGFASAVSLWVLFVLSLTSPANPSNGMAQVMCTILSIPLGYIAFRVDRWIRIGRVRRAVDLIERRLRR